MSNLVKVCILVITVATVISLLHFFVFRPIHKDNELGRCLERAESVSSYYKVKQDYRDNCFKQY